ncbi:uroporphyrinogen-III synthase [Thioclava sp.]|uniref:uroporphyrinogen-III synthase n=1 Tax=Thioclava sp. TaxID=1933450 RepID=UPI003AA963C1
MGERIEKPILLLTRPRTSSEAFARQFHARFGADWPVIVSPLLEIVPLDATIPPADALIFTSQHGVNAFATHEGANGRVAYCVGARTAQAAQAAGFRAIVGDGGAKALVPIIAAAYRGESLLHARGEEVAFDVQESLNSAGIVTKSVILYRQHSLPLSAEAITALKRERGLLVPLFSPNSARAFHVALPDPHAPLLIAAISAAVAQSCAPAADMRIEVAPSPDANGMLEAISSLLRAQMAG